jgi:phytoene dehydrogenase-like protein
MADFDAVIIGGGHNGLVCANYLAKAGKKVCVLERRNIIGGAAVTEELWPGFRLSVASYWMSLMQPKIMIDLDLVANGVKVLPTAPGIQPFSDGRVLVYWDDAKRTCDEIRQFSPEDAEAYPRFVKHMEGLVVHLRKLLFEVPVDPTTGRFKDVAKALAFAWRFKAIGPKFYDLWDLLTLSAQDFLRRWFVSPQVLAALGSYVSGASSFFGPKVPGTAYVLARPFIRDSSTAAGPGGLVQGGMGSITQALTKTAQKHGVQIKLNATVEKVLVENGKAKGVRLASGETISAKIVVSNAASKLLFTELIDRKDVPAEVVDAARRIKTDSSVFKINLALRNLPKWTALEARGLDFNPGSITLAESMDELQGNFEAVERGEMCENPYMWIVTPSAFDSTVAPAGFHTMNIMGGHVPYKLRSGPWDEAAHEKLFDIIATRIERYAPGFRNEVLHKQVLVPPDIEAIFNLPGGHVHQGELTIDQTFFRRPIAHYADYRSPIAGLYQCGASMHPGGGVTGVPGHNAAKVILSDN